MRAVEFWAIGLALLCAWGVYATARTYRPPSASSRRRKRALAVDVLFSASCALCAVSLWSQWFRPWMVAPFGASYLLMIPMPCYFETVDRVPWLRRTRNLVFVAVAAASFAIAGGLIPLSWLGI